MTKTPETAVQSWQKYIQRFKLPFTEWGIACMITQPGWFGQNVIANLCTSKHSFLSGVISVRKELTRVVIKWRRSRFEYCCILLLSSILEQAHLLLWRLINRKWETRSFSDQCCSGKRKWCEITTDYWSHPKKLFRNLFCEAWHKHFVREQKCFCVSCVSKLGQRS